MKTHPIEKNVELRFIGPENNEEKAVTALEQLGFRNANEEELIPLRNIFPNKLTPGKKLKAYRIREDLTQAQLSNLTGIPKGLISEIENEKKSINMDMAQKLAKVLNVPAGKFLL